MNKKRQKAVALSYDVEEPAPKVVAKGEGLVAENIVKKAKESNIVIYEDSKLVEDLIQLNLNQEIPEELYEVVAEVIFYVYKLDQEKGSRYEL